MRELKEAIARDGICIGQDIVKVDMFLNHRIDTGLMFRMGEELAKRFADAKPDLILTVEASGIALALTTARAMGDVPVLFAKKAATVVQSPDVAQASVYSFTHKRENIIRVDKKFLPKGSRVLIVDDFLATGAALVGLKSLCEQAGATVVGAGIAIEKLFQGGGDALRAGGMRVESLARIASMSDDGLCFD